MKEIRDLSDKEFRVTRVKMFIRIRLNRKLNEFDERIDESLGKLWPPSARARNCKRRFITFEFIY